MKLIKRSRWNHVNAEEYYAIPATTMWLEHIVTVFFHSGKILAAGRRMDIGDIAYLVLFPVRLLTVLLFGGVSHWYTAKKFTRRYGTDTTNLYLKHEAYYTLDWKRHLSGKPNSWDLY